MSPKRYVIAFLILSSFLLIVQGAMNFIVDPFRIFGNKLITNYDINPRYTKLKAISEDPDRYNAFILGTCVSSVLRPERASAISGYRYFNLSTHNSHPLEPYIFLKYLLGKGVKVKQVILNLEGYRSLDMKDSEKRWEQREKRLDIRMPYFVDKKGSLEFFAPYLFSWIATKRSYLALFNHIKGVNPPIVEEADGYWHWKNALVSMTRDSRSHASNAVLATAWYSNLHKKELKNRTPPKQEPVTLKYLGQFHTLANSNGIEVIYFMPPAWAFRNFGVWQGRASSWMVREWVARIGEFYDFALYNSITLDPFNYLNRENFTPEVGDRVIAMLFGKCDGYFCKHVTKSNQEEYIALKNWQEEVFAKRIIPLLKERVFERWIEIDFTSLSSVFERGGSSGKTCGHLLSVRPFAKIPKPMSLRNRIEESM